MPAIDFKALFEEERARRRRARADGATTTTASGDAGAGAVSSAPPGVVFAPRERLRLADHDVGACRGIAGLHYVPDFITPDEEAAVLAGVYASGTERRWTPSCMRRVQNWGGSPGSLEVTEPLPPFADALRAAIVQSGVYSPADAPNHVLVNEYRRPAGIAPHNDGAVYAPRVAIITLRGSALMDFWPDDGSPALDDDRSERARAPDAPVPVAQVLLRPRSLLVYEGDAYRLRHGIREASEDRVGPTCANGTVVDVATGDVVERGETRLSVVFVRKGDYGG